MRWMDRLLWVELEVERVIKAANPYISLHPMNDLKAAKAKPRLIYRFKG